MSATTALAMARESHTVSAAANETTVSIAGAVVAIISVRSTAGESNTSPSHTVARGTRGIMRAAADTAAASFQAPLYRDNQRPQYSRREQHEPLPYGSPRNTRYREGGGRYGSSEFPGAPRHVKQDTGQSEWQRAEEKRREQEARELQQIGARTTRGSCSSRHWTWILRAQTPRPSWMERPTRSAHGGKRTARLSPIYLPRHRQHRVVQRQESDRQ